MIICIGCLLLCGLCGLVLEVLLTLHLKLHSFFAVVPLVSLGSLRCFVANYPEDCPFELCPLFAHAILSPCRFSFLYILHFFTGCSLSPLSSVFAHGASIADGH